MIDCLEPIAGRRWESPRWRAVLTYRTDARPVDVIHDIEELDELPDLVELNPNWNALVDIRVTLARRLYPNKIVEQPPIRGV